MRIKTIASFVLALLVAVPMFGQSLSVNYKARTIEKVISDLESKTNYTFVYQKQEVAGAPAITLSLQNAPFTDILASVCAEAGLTYEIVKQSVVLRKEQAKPASNKNVSVNGIVTDLSGMPVIGASVFVQGTTNGVSTDVDGRYSISTQAGATLVYSCIGYSEVNRLAVDGVINVTLEDDATLLEETVVIGYGSVRKGDLTGAIASVNSEKVAERSSQMLSNALQGQVAGLQVTRASGEAGESASIVIRGMTTMSTNDPLVIIDGVPGSLDDVISEDVQSIAVLKDAASAAIYGARAAAGVIIITTKRAKSNSFQLNYNYSYAIDTPTTRPQLGNAVDYLNAVNEMRFSDGASDPTYTKEYIDSYASKHAENPYLYPDTNWMDVVLKKTSSHQEHSFSVSGGSDNIRTKFTFGYQTGDGYYANKNFQRYSARSNNDWQITKWLHATVDLDFTMADRNSPASGNPIGAAFICAPIYGPYNQDGTYNDVKDGNNILAATEQSGIANKKDYSLGGKAQIDITPVKGLTITGVVAPRFSFAKYKSFNKAVQCYYADGTPRYHAAWNTNDLKEERNDTQSITYQAFANYQNRWAGHSLNVMAGYEGYTYAWENLGASRDQFTLSNFPYLNLGPEDKQYNSGKAGHNAYQSFFGRAIYSFKDRYILQANVRADGSSRFAKANRWGVFPSVSLGWVMSEENWFNLAPVSYLKLRASYGMLGNERIGREFPYQASMSFGNSYMWDNSKKTVNAIQNAYQEFYAFNDITWETTTTADFGIDANFFDGRLRFSGDIYHKDTKNMLLTLGFPSYAGFKAPEQNAGTMYTNGWDIELGWADRVGDFSYSISANLSDYRSKMGYVGEKTVVGNYLIEEGSYFHEWYMLKADGLFQTEDQLKDAALYSKNDTLGDIRYVNQNDDTTINADDKVKLGNSLPELIYGGNISLGYKNWDFNLSFQGVGHQLVMFQPDWYRPVKDNWGSVPAIALGNYWSKNNTAEQNANAKYPRLTNTNVVSQTVGSDFWLFNGAYCRIKNIGVGYTLPESLMSKTFIKGVRVYANVTDLPAISAYPKGWDPELGSYNFQSEGYRKYSDFFSTSFIFGVNVRF